jgi:hypothetical protein
MFALVQQTTLITAFEAALKSLHFSGSIADLALPSVYHAAVSFRMMVECGFLLLIVIDLYRRLDALAAGLERIASWLRRQDARLRALPAQLRAAWCRSVASKLRKWAEWLET